jgi:hypothetical protein
MIPIGTPPDNASPQLLEAWNILQQDDRSPNQLEKIRDLAAQLPDDHPDRPKFGGLIEAFRASS